MDPQPTNLSIDDVRNGLKRLMPALRAIAWITPNKIDDAAVAFLETLLLQPQQLAAAMAPITSRAELEN